MLPGKTVHTHRIPKSTVQLDFAPPADLGNCSCRGDDSRMIPKELSRCQYVYSYGHKIWWCPLLTYWPWLINMVKLMINRSLVTNTSIVIGSIMVNRSIMATIPKSRNQIPSPRSKIQGSNWFQALLFVVAMSLHLAHHESFEIIVKKNITLMFGITSACLGLMQKPRELKDCETKWTISCMRYIILLYIMI